MRRGAVGAVFLAGVALFGSGQGRGAVAPPFNIVIVKTDDQRWDTVTRLVDGEPVMPQVTALLAQPGLTFTDAYTPSPTCCPDRAALLAGGYLPQHTGVLSNLPPNGGAGRFIGPDTRGLAVALQAAGYRTGLFGKYLNDFHRIQPYQPPGWTAFVASLHAGDWFTFEVLDNGVRRWLACEQAACPARASCPYATDFYRDRAVDFVKEHAATSPVFVVYAPLAPHGPATPACRHQGLFPTFTYRERGWCEVDRSDKPTAVLRRADVCSEPDLRAAQDAFVRDQLRSLRAVDEAVAALVAATASARHPTVFFFTSDNGYAWGEHRLDGKGLPYEEMIRVPFIARMPEGAVGTTRALVAPTLDLGPTIRELAGLPPDPGSDGRTLGAFLRGERTAAWDRTLPLQLDRWAGLLVRAGTRTVKYIEHGATGERELYVLRDGRPIDPFELENRIGDPAYAPLVQSLGAILPARRGLAITTEPEVPPATVSVPFMFRLRAWGGAPPYRWRLHEQSPHRLFGGLTLTPEADGSATIAGRPLRTGWRRVWIAVEDSQEVLLTGRPQEDVVELILTVNAAP